MLDDIKVVSIGGGTGQSAMLRGLKKITSDITAIVTVTDDGGGSGVLRSELDMPPPGDIRNCISALSRDEDLMAKLLSYRYSSGSLSGQSFGNLLIAAMNGISETFDEAVEKVSEVLNITGRVLPVTNDKVWLCAEFEDGTYVRGEAKISDAKINGGKRIKSIHLYPEHPTVLESCIESINAADVIIIGPGSLYTSVVPNLLVDGIADAIRKNNCRKIYVCNVMTQHGETDNYKVSDHIKAVFSHVGFRLFDTCLVNTSVPTIDAQKAYLREMSLPVVCDTEEVNALGVEVVSAPLITHGGLIRHDPDKLAYALAELF